MRDSLSRRGLIRLGGGLAITGAVGHRPSSARADEEPIRGRPLLTASGDFEDVTRNDPPPTDLSEEQLRSARLTPETWRLEVYGDASAKVPNPRRLDAGSAIDLPMLEELGRSRGVKYLKAMQCLNIAQPLGQGLWEGVPLAEVLRLLGPLEDVRRLFYWGFHNDDPEQLFQSSLSYSQALETPPGELPAFLAYRLNGEPLPLERGGPVRMVVPWAHGFKSIKWLRAIVLTNDYRPNDTYATQNNDPESWLKSAAYLDEEVRVVPAAGRAIVTGTVIAGRSGVDRVECWVRPAPAGAGELAPEDPAWAGAEWVAARIEGPPEDWSAVLPAGVRSTELLGFDLASGRPVEWPARYGMAGWSLVLEGVGPGAYEVRARAVDRNGYAQPEPRPYPKSGRNALQVRRFEVVG